MNLNSGTHDLELLIRRIIREETGLTPVAPAEKWRGGELVLKPGKPGVQEKTWPIESFFHKVVMLRTACARSSSRSTRRICPTIRS